MSTRLHYQDELAGLERRALQGLALVRVQLDCVLEALRKHDLQLARSVIADAGRLDSYYLEVHQGILSLLARQAPVAGDLRLIAALLHLIKHVERMGDQCVNVAELILVCGNPPSAGDELLWMLMQMGTAARDEVMHCRRAFLARNVAMAKSLIGRGRDLNRLDREIFRAAIDVADDDDAREWAMSMILVARAFERIGNNAVEIGEQTVYVVTGQFREPSAA